MSFSRDAAPVSPSGFPFHRSLAVSPIRHHCRNMAAVTKFVTGIQRRPLHADETLFPLLEHLYEVETYMTIRGYSRPLAVWTSSFGTCLVT